MKTTFEESTFFHFEPFFNKIVIDAITKPCNRPLQVKYTVFLSLVGATDIFI